MWQLLGLTEHRRTDRAFHRCKIVHIGVNSNKIGAVNMIGSSVLGGMGQSSMPIAHGCEFSQIYI